MNNFFAQFLYFSGIVRNARLYITLLALPLTGCASTFESETSIPSNASLPSAVTTDSANLPNGPTPAEGSMNTSNFHAAARLRTGLSVSVTVIVAGQEEIAQTGVRVSEQGTLSLPLVGNVQVDGLTLRELQDRVTLLYQEYLINPQVAVQFELSESGSTPWGAVTVLGRVVKPGKVSIPATQDLTVSAAFQEAGGFAPSAKESGIVVTRKDREGNQQRISVDLRSLGRRGETEEDILLKAGDFIFVPEEIF